VQPDDINCGAGVVPCGDKAEAHKMKIITYDVRIEVSKNRLLKIHLSKVEHLRSDML
jgi:hypothetical protein